MVCRSSSGSWEFRARFASIRPDACATDALVLQIVDQLGQHVFAHFPVPFDRLERHHLNVDHVP